MNVTDWLAVLSLLCTAGLGIWTLRNSRRSTDQAAEVTLRGQDLALLKDAQAKAERAEARAQRNEEYNRQMWVWARRHMDLYFKWRRDDAPDPAPIPEPADLP